MNLKSVLVETIKEHIDFMDSDEIMEFIEVPKDSNMGDYAFPCFRLAKQFRKAPNKIAEDLVKSIKLPSEFDKVENMGGYLNFFINRELFVKETLEDVLQRKEDYGKINIGDGKNIIVEFSSPNIAKPFHIGHIRTTVIGNAIKRIYDYLGFNTIAINHLGDYGTQFGKLIVAFKKWGNEDDINNDPIQELLKLYIKFHEEAETNNELEEESREWFKKLENKDEEAVKLWKWFKDVSLKEFNKVYSMLGIEFDSFAGESFYGDMIPDIIKLIESKGILKESDGAYIIDLESEDMPPALIKKRDGSSLYITRDIAAAIYRKEKYNFEKALYVVGTQQSLHFKQLFKVLDLIDKKDISQSCEHIGFGTVSLEDGTLSTRKGRVVFLEDVFKKAVDKTKEIIKEKNPDLENINKVSEDVGIGAVLFQELNTSRLKDYTFSWDKTLNFQGETGPYVQYTHARMSSILRRADGYEFKFDEKLLVDDISISLIKLLKKFPDVLKTSIDKNEPSHLTRYTLELAKGFNLFYHEFTILDKDLDIRNTRISLVYAIRQVLKNSLNILGIEAPEKM